MIHTVTKVTGYLTVTLIKADGRKIEICKDRPNLVCNGRFNTNGGLMNISSAVQQFVASNDARDPYETLPGTWSQSGNTVTRTTGAGTFPSSPSQLGNELKWEDGERCHVTARASDTSITVSGPARTITGKTIKRYHTGSGYAPTTSNQTQNSTGVAVETVDAVAGTWQGFWQANFASASSAYTLNSVWIGNGAPYAAWIKLAVPVAIAVDDALQMSYTLVLTVTNRTQAFELGVNDTGLPTKYTASTIVGNGTYFDIVTSAANHFAAGDKILLENIVPKRFAISSASSNSTTMTINTTLAHGLSVSDSVTIEGATPSGYNGTHTVATVVDTDTITITSSNNPGAMGAVGTIRLATPVTYFNGEFTVASKPTTSTVRVTSTIQGPVIDPALFGSVRRVRYDIFGGIVHNGRIGGSNYYMSEANVRAIPAPESTTNPSITGGVARNTEVVTQALYNNDWTWSKLLTWNAGVAESRLKQIIGTYGNLSEYGFVFTFEVPQSKTTADRFQFNCSVQMIRDLP